MNSENRTSDNLEEHVSGVQRLAEALVQAKLKSVEHDDSVAELRETGRIRLELLKQELAEVFAAVPNDDPYWDFAMSWRRGYGLMRQRILQWVVIAEAIVLSGILGLVVSFYARLRICQR